MIILLLALIGTLIVMAILSIGRLAFGRRELFIARKFVRWFVGYFVFNYIFCLLILYVSEPALTGPFGGWQWILFPLVVSSIPNVKVEAPGTPLIPTNPNHIVLVSQSIAAFKGQQKLGSTGQNLGSAYSL